MSEKGLVVWYERNSFLNMGESRSKEAGREERPENLPGQQHGKEGVDHQARAREHL